MPKNITQTEFVYNPHVPQYELIQNGEIVDTRATSLFTEHLYAWKCAQSYPILAGRLWKAAAIIRAGAIDACKPNPASFSRHLLARIETISRPEPYSILRKENGHAECTCKDGQSFAPYIHGERLCKHVLAYRLLMYLHSLGKVNITWNTTAQAPINKNERYRTAFELRRGIRAKGREFDTTKEHVPVRRRGIRP